jgi:chromosome condensin MukBEF MukE localization factor
MNGMDWLVGWLLCVKYYKTHRLITDLVFNSQRENERKMEQGAGNKLLRLLYSRYRYGILINEEAVDSSG